MPSSNTSAGSFLNEAETIPKKAMLIDQGHLIMSLQ